MGPIGIEGIILAQSLTKLRRQIILLGKLNFKFSKVGTNTLSTKRNAQSESCELSFIWSFIWGKMRTTAGETASQTALRNCSKEVGGEGQRYIRS